MVDIGGLLGKVGDSLGVDKVGDSVQWVFDNKDALGDAIEFVRDIDDKVLALVKSLPATLAGLGEGLANAGEQAHQAAAALLGSDGESGAFAVVDHGANLLGGVTEQLNGAVSLLSGVADDVGKVGIPSIEPRFSEVLGFKVISGVEMDTTPVLSGPAEKLKAGVDSVGSVSENLSGLAEDLAKLAGALTSIGRALDGLGNGLEGSGSTISSLMGAPSSNGDGGKPPAKKAAAKKAPAKKAPAKKGATKKAPAKETAKAPAKKGATKKAPAKKT